MVWLKGGDPGLFGRLGEITQTLAEWGLPFRVIPGVSSLSVATTGTGFLLTRRGERETFMVTTGQKAEGCIPSWGSSKALQVPMVLFMARQKVSQLTARLMAEGWPPSTPATAVLGAGSPSEQIIETTLHELPHHLTIQTTQAPALLLVNMPADFRFTKEGGPLAGARVLLTCSRTVMKRAEQAVRRYGGLPVPCPLIRTVLASETFQGGAPWVKGDALLLTSPSAVEMLLQALRQMRCDLRALPALVTWGPQTAAALEAHGLYSSPLADLAAVAWPSANRRRLLWLRSDQADRSVVAVAHQAGWSVEDRVLYRNEPVQVFRWPPGESVLFLSGSAVRVWMDQRGPESLKDLTVGVFPGSALATLHAYGRRPEVVASAAAVEALVAALAAHAVTQALQKEMTR